MMMMTMLWEILIISQTQITGYLYRMISVLWHPFPIYRLGIVALAMKRETPVASYRSQKSSSSSRRNWGHVEAVLLTTWVRSLLTRSMEMDWETKWRKLVTLSRDTSSSNLSSRIGLLRRWGPQWSLYRSFLVMYPRQSKITILSLILIPRRRDRLIELLRQARKIQRSLRSLWRINHQVSSTSFTKKAL